MHYLSFFEFMKWSELYQAHWIFYIEKQKNMREILSRTLLNSFQDKTLLQLHQNMSITIRLKLSSPPHNLQTQIKEWIMGYKKEKLGKYILRTLFSPRQKEALTMRQLSKLTVWILSCSCFCNPPKPWPILFSKNANSVSTKRVVIQKNKYLKGIRLIFFSRMILIFDSGFKNKIIILNAAEIFTYVLTV